MQLVFPAALPCAPGEPLLGKRPGSSWTVPSARKLGMRALTGGQGWPPLLCFLLPGALGRRPGFVFWETCGDLRPARQGKPPSQRENGKVGVSEARADRTGKEKGVGAGGGRRQNKFRKSEGERSPVLERKKGGERFPGIPSH